MSYYHGRMGDFFSGVSGSALNLGLTALGTAIGGPIGGAVGAAAGTIGTAFGSAMGELGRTGWGQFFGGGGAQQQLDSLINQLGGMGTFYGSAPSRANAISPPGYDQNFGFTMPDTPFTRAGPPISSDWGIPDTYPPVYQSYTNTYEDEGYGGIDWQSLWS